MNSSRRHVFPALVAAGVLWGTTVPLSKVALGWLGPAWLTFVRFGLAAAVLMLVSRSRLRGAWSPAVVISGAAGYGGSVLLQNIGVERTSVTHAALLIGATPVLVAIMAAILRHSVARPVAWVGFAVSLAGVTVIAGRQGSGSSLSGDGLVLAAQLISAAFTVSQARLLRGRDPVAVTALQLAAAGVAVLPVALMAEAAPASPTSPGALLALLALVLAGTVLPTAFFATAQSKVSADVAGAFVNLEPLVGAAAGTALFGDPVGSIQLAGGVAIVAGIALSSFQAIRSGRSRHHEALAVAAGPAAGRAGAAGPVAVPAWAVTSPAGASADDAPAAAASARATAVLTPAHAGPLPRPAGASRRARLRSAGTARSMPPRRYRISPASRRAHEYPPARGRPVRARRRPVDDGPPVRPDKSAIRPIIADDIGREPEPTMLAA